MGNKNSNIGFIGNLGDKNIIGGQITKTRDLFAAILARKGVEKGVINNFLENGIGNSCFNQEGLYIADFKSNNILKLMLQVFKIFNNCQNIILILASFTYLRILPFVLLLNRIYKRNLYEFVIGGVRHEYLKQNDINNEKYIKKIFVESTYMKDCYEKLGLNNVVYMPNFKHVKPINSEEINMRDDKVLRCCTYSRVDPYKGIDDAIKIIKRFGENTDHITLDIIGPVDRNFDFQFNTLLENKPATIKYFGVIDGNNSSKILKDYDVLLCPTKWKAEGFPGSFIDSMQAGLVILATDKPNFRDIIINDENGWLLAENDIDGYLEKLRILDSNKNLLRKMQKKALSDSMKYDTDIVLKNFLDELME